MPNGLVYSFLGHHPFDLNANSSSTSRITSWQSITGKSNHGGVDMACYGVKVQNTTDPNTSLRRGACKSLLPKQLVTVMPLNLRCTVWSSVFIMTFHSTYPSPWTQKQCVRLHVLFYNIIVGVAWKTNTTVKKNGVSQIFSLKKLILLFRKDTLNSSKATVKTCIMLQKISISNMIMYGNFL